MPTIRSNECKLLQDSKLRQDMRHVHLFYLIRHRCLRRNAHETQPLEIVVVFGSRQQFQQWAKANDRQWSMYSPSWHVRALHAQITLVVHLQAAASTIMINAGCWCGSRKLLYVVTDSQCRVNNWYYYNVTISALSLNFFNWTVLISTYASNLAGSATV